MDIKILSYYTCAKILQLDKNLILLHKFFLKIYLGQENYKK